MSDSHTHQRSSSHLPKAKLRKGRLNWLLWLVPVAALLLCAWYVYSSILSKGPTLTIYFDSIEELQADSSPVKYRGANIGTVTSVKLTPDSRRVKVQAQLDGSSANVARQGSLFWIVRPQVSVGAIRGLRTIVSGNFLAVRPGNGPRTNVFNGLEEPPVTEANGNPVDIVLLSPDLASVQKGTPIYYRGIQVGEVLSYKLGSDAQAVRIRARIQQQYTPLVRANSRFWNAGGVNVSFGLFSGADISALSPKTLLSGGIAFATPPDYGPPATNGLAFRLYDKEDDKWKEWAPTIPLGHLQQVAQTQHAETPDSE